MRDLICTKIEGVDESDIVVSIEMDCLNSIVQRQRETCTGPWPTTPHQLSCKIKRNRKDLNTAPHRHHVLFLPGNYTVPTPILHGAGLKESFDGHLYSFTLSSTSGRHCEHVTIMECFSNRFRICCYKERLAVLCEKTRNTRCGVILCNFKSCGE